MMIDQDRRHNITNLHQNQNGQQTQQHTQNKYHLDDYDYKEYDGYSDDEIDDYFSGKGGGSLTYAIPTLDVSSTSASSSPSQHSRSSTTSSSSVSNSKHRYHKDFHHLGLTQSIIETSVSYCPAKVVCLSACADVQKSAGISNVDKLGMSFVPKGSDGGACTSLFLQILYHHHKQESYGGNKNKSLPPLTYEQILQHMYRVCERNGYNQLPQLTSSRPVRLDKDPFFVVPPNFDPSKNTKHALLVGINYKGTPFQLSGCHNDCRNMRHFLKEIHCFDDSNIIMMLDDDHDPTVLHPTKANLWTIFRQLAFKCREGDVVFIHFSGHGVAVPDESGDEPDGMDEAIMPCDYLINGEIVDDDVFRLLLMPLPRNVYVTAVVDCCHSGSMLDLPFEYTLRQDGSFDCDYDLVTFPHMQMVQDYQTLKELQSGSGSRGRRRYPVLEKNRGRKSRSLQPVEDSRHAPSIQGQSTKISEMKTGRPRKRRSKSFVQITDETLQSVQRLESPTTPYKKEHRHLKPGGVSPCAGTPKTKKPSVYETSTNKSRISKPKSSAPSVSPTKKKHSHAMKDAPMSAGADHIKSKKSTPTLSLSPSPRTSKDKPQKSILKTPTNQKVKVISKSSLNTENDEQDKPIPKTPTSPKVKIIGKSSSNTGSDEAYQDHSRKKKNTPSSRPNSLSPTRSRPTKLLTPPKSVQSRPTTQTTQNPTRATSPSRREHNSIPSPPFGMSDSTLNTKECTKNVNLRARSPERNKASFQPEVPHAQHRKVETINAYDVIDRQRKVDKKKDRGSHLSTTHPLPQSPQKYGRHATVGLSTTPTTPNPTRRPPQATTPDCRSTTPRQSNRNHEKKDKEFQKVVPSHHSSLSPVPRQSPRSHPTERTTKPKLTRGTSGSSGRRAVSPVPRQSPHSQPTDRTTKPKLTRCTSSSGGRRSVSPEPRQSPHSQPTDRTTKTKIIRGTSSSGVRRAVSPEPRKSPHSQPTGRTTKTMVTGGNNSGGGSGSRRARSHSPTKRRPGTKSTEESSVAVRVRAGGSRRHPPPPPRQQKQQQQQQHMYQRSSSSSNSSSSNSSSSPSKHSISVDSTVHHRKPLGSRHITTA